MRVLLAVDGSASSELAADLVANLAWPAASRILVAEAVETGLALFGGPWPGLAVLEIDGIETQIREQARRVVAATRDRLARPDVTFESIVLGGRPATAIVHQAREMRADLIVVGSRGHGTIESMLLGSVSAEVVDHAPAPVLVARRRQVARVVLAWDGSASAERAADVVATWPVFAGSDVRVVSVANIGTPWWTGFPAPGSAEVMPMYVDAANASREQHDALTRDMAARLRGVGISAEPDRREGDAATEILAAARAWDADMVVMGTHGRTGVSRLVLGSVARNVVRHAPCSVMVVRPISPPPTDG